MAEVDRHYSDPALAALYDLDSGWGEDRQYFLDLAGVTPIRVLDLGCGEGKLLRELLADRAPARILIRHHRECRREEAARPRYPHGARAMSRKVCVDLRRRNFAGATSYAHSASKPIGERFFGRRQSLLLGSTRRWELGWKAEAVPTHENDAVRSIGVQESASSPRNSLR